jgi:hypothetical protein
MKFFTNIFRDKNSPEFKFWKLLINFIIFISCLEVAIETDKSLASNLENQLKIVEYIAVVFFTFDYLGNVIIARNRIKYIFSIWGLIDLLAILPTILQVAHLTGFQGIKLMRTLQVAKMMRIFKMLHLAIEASKSESATTDPIKTNLKIYFTCFFLVIMTSSTLMYYIEGGCYSEEVMTEGQHKLDVLAHLKNTDTSFEIPPAVFIPTDPLTGNEIPDDKRVFTSIPQSAWWSFLAVTGNSEFFPVTLGGKLVAAVTYFLGLILFGILINIVGKSIMKNFFIDPEPHTHISKEEIINLMIQLNWITNQEKIIFLDLPQEEINLRLRILCQL